MENKQEIEIDVLEYIFVLLRRWWIILIAAVVCGSGMFVYTKFMVTPMYKSVAKLYVLPTNEEKQPTAQDAQMALSFIDDFQNTVTGRTTLEGVINRLGLDMRYEDLSKMVTGTSSSSSRIITVSVSHSDPIEAQRLNAAICEEAEVVLANMVEADLVNVSEKAYLPVSPYSPNVMKNVALGALIGIVLSCAIMFIVFIADDKIKVPSDVETQLGLSTLGMIPLQKIDTAKKHSAH